MPDTTDQGSDKEGVNPLSEPPYRDRWVPEADVRLAGGQPGDPLFSSLYVLPTQSFPSMIHDPPELTSSRAQPRRFAPSSSMTTVMARWVFGHLRGVSWAARQRPETRDERRQL